MGLKGLYLLAFPAIAFLAFNCILVNSDKNGVGRMLEEVGQPNAVAYTGLAPVDKYLAMLVTVFHVAMEPGLPFEFTFYFLGACAPVMAFTYPIEAYRKDSPFLIGFPTIYGVLYQTVTFGIVNPVWSMLFVFSGAAANYTRTRSHISQAHAEAILFSIVVGGLVPSAALFAVQDKYVTAVWQFFPVICMLGREAYLFFQPTKKYQKDGFKTVKFALIACFVSTAALHAAIVYPKVKQPERLLDLFAPSPYALGEGASLQAGVLNLLQWDFICGMGSGVLLILWFAENVKQFFSLLLYILVVLPLGGPGATIAGGFLWRESRLKSLSHQKKK